MIISAPMMVEKYNGNNNSEKSSYSQKYEEDYSRRDYDNHGSNGTYDEIKALENRLNSRIDSLSQNMNNSGTTISNKYICTIEGGLDVNGIVVPINTSNPPAKFVFACEYRN